MILWNEWWVWGVAALVLAVGEVLIPSWVLLGFAIGAGVIALLLAIGLPIAGNAYILLLIFAVVSLVAWLVLRRMLGVMKGQVKTFDHDINE